MTRHWCIRPLLALTAALALCAPAFAKDCPVEDSSLDAREQAIRKAPSCKEALEVMQSCAYGASGDVTLSSAVVEVCEAGFLGRLSKAQRRSYDREMRRCDAKYRHESGTMYRSFEAFCRAELAVRYQTRMAKAPIRR